MKPIKKCDRRQVTRDTDGNLNGRLFPRRRSRVTRQLAAFTLIELLTVIAIIAILAAILLPALGYAKTAAKKTQAKLQISDLATAIQKYDSDYSRMPVSTADQLLAVTNDFTFGGVFQTPTGPTTIGNVTTNSDVIAILMDLTNFPDGAPTVNANHVKNPQRTLYLNAKRVADTATWPGVGPDLVYRDPWGDPYVISMDVNYDGECRDAFYSRSAVSKLDGSTGYFGLVDPTDTGGNDNNFEYHGKVMVWSAGPDKKVDPGAKANQGVNKDNILSWQ
ncbi:MAG: prepilin-type N-terminal cleavage/methylation domain-containing protein [Verrucomicrobiota bacterium]|nr:prepilin-type N-terminal cleavage/methylation domain-containing protein [Verrucomicrobiota bacterium]